MTRQAPRILIIRTDSIGDVMLTLPMCGWIKRHLPASVIHFLGRTYTEPIIQHCSHVDAFINADELSAVEEQRQIAQLSQLKFDIAIHVFPIAHWMRISRKAGIPMRIASGHRLSSWRWCSHRVAFPDEGLRCMRHSSILSCSNQWDFRCQERWMRFTGCMDFIL